jgi:hypothetical protein
MKWKRLKKSKKCQAQLQSLFRMHRISIGLSCLNIQSHTIGGFSLHSNGLTRPRENPPEPSWCHPHHVCAEICRVQIWVPDGILSSNLIT